MNASKKKKAKKKRQSKKTSKKRQSQSQAKTSKAKAKKPVTKKLDRLMSSVVVLNGIKTSQAYHTAVRNADELYCRANDAESNLRESNFAFKRASKVMCILRIIRIEDGTIHRLSPSVLLK